MPSLGSTILQRDAASAPVVEEALARQVLYGGDLATNLLELRALSEARLHELQAESLTLPASASGRLAHSSVEARRSVSAEIAERHCVYPLEFGADVLVIAVSSLLPASVVEELEVGCGRKVVQQAALALRIHEALVRDYATPPNRRFERLSEVLDGRLDPDPTVPPDKNPGPLQGALSLTAPLTPRTAEDAESVPPTVVVESRPSPATGQRAPAAARGDAAAAASRASWRPRRRGPYTAADAESALRNAAERDDIVRAFFDFASQYFEYSALFAVHGDIAEGRDAYGPGADRKRLAAIGVPLDLGSILSQPWRSGRWQLSVLSSDGLNGSLARDLERSTGKVVVVVPVVVRDRVVMLLYGDHGEVDVELAQIGDVIAFAPLVSKVLERLLVQRKLSLQGKSLGASLMPPSPGGAGLEPSGFPPHDGASGGGAQDTFSSIDRDAVDKARLDLVGSLNPAAAPSLHAALEVNEQRPVPDAIVEVAPARADREIRAGAEAVASRFRDGIRPAQPTMSFPFRVPNAGETVGVSEPVPLRTLQPNLGDPFAEATLDEGWGVPSSLLPRPLPELVAPRFPETSRSLAADDGVRGAPGEVRDRAGWPLAAIVSNESAVGAVRSEALDELPYLIEQLLEGDRSVLEPIIALGDAALGYLIFHFPGPIHDEPIRPGARRASECGILLEAMVRIGSASVPFVAVRSADAQPDVRRWATLVLAELPSPDSVRAILSRLGDREGPVRQAAAAAARQLLGHGAGRYLVEGALRDMVGVQRDKSTRLTAFEYLAEVRHPLVVPMLLETLKDSDRDMARSAEWALGVLCRQSFGMNLNAWTDWWEENRYRPRAEWLMDSLTHPQPSIRRAAAEELRVLTQQTFGFRDDLPAAELARAQARFREWWVQKGIP